MHRPGDADRDLAGHEVAHGREDGEVGGDPLLDARAEDLDRDRRPVGEDGPVDDGEGGGGDRRLVEGREQRGERPAEVGLHGGADVVERDGRPGIETGAELRGDVLAEQRRRRRDQLAELGEGPAEVVERAADHARHRRPVEPAAAPGRDQVPDGRTQTEPDPRRHLAPDGTGSSTGRGRSAGSARAVTGRRR